MPVLDTHEGAPLLEVRSISPISWYLLQSGQYQRWSMFDERLVNIRRLRVEYETEAGEREGFDLRDSVASYGLLRRRNWRNVETALLNPARRAQWVPRGTDRILDRFAPEGIDAIVRAEALKLAYPVPLLEPDDTGNPLFTSAAAWRKVLDDPDSFVRLPMIETEIPAPLGETEP